MEQAETKKAVYRMEGKRALRVLSERGMRVSEELTPDRIKHERRRALRWLRKRRPRKPGEKAPQHIQLMVINQGEWLKAALSKGR